MPSPQRAVSRPSRIRRVASPTSRAESSSEYGPRGRTTISVTSASLLPRLDTAAQASCGASTCGLRSSGVARPLDLLLALLMVAAVLLFFARGHGRPANAILADPLRTPGVLNLDVTQANIRSTICRHGWTATIRPPVGYPN